MPNLVVEINERIRRTIAEKETVKQAQSLSDAQNLSTCIVAGKPKPYANAKTYLVPERISSADETTHELYR